MTTNKQRRCIFCKKTLIDEKFVCRRCKLEARDIGGGTFGTLAGGIFTYKGAKSIAKSFRKI